MISLRNNLFLWKFKGGQVKYKQLPLKYIAASASGNLCLIKLETRTRLGLVHVLEQEPICVLVIARIPTAY